MVIYYVMQNQNMVFTKPYWNGEMFSEEKTTIKTFNSESYINFITYETGYILNMEMFCKDLNSSIQSIKYSKNYE